MTDNNSGQWWHELTIENVDWRENSPLANAFSDFLLLSLIRAHPMQVGEKPDLERLRDAKEAVFGIKPRDDLKAIRDLPFLAVMAREYIADRGGAEFLGDSGELRWGDHDPKLLRGTKELARHAITQAKARGEVFGVMVMEDSIIHRLARKFKAQQEDLIKEVAAQSGIETGYIFDWLMQVQAILGPVGIPMLLPEDLVRDMKFLF